MPEPSPATRLLAQHWRRKFACAFRGLYLGIRGQGSFLVHFSMAVAVAACAAGMGVSRQEWLVLLLCVTIVLTAELFNSALESLAKAVTAERNEHIGAALDMGSAAVLMASLGASLIGLLIFVRRLFELLGWM